MDCLNWTARRSVVMGFLLVSAWYATGSLVAQEAKGQQDSVPDPFPKKIAAPALTGGTEWINTSGPITLESLKGKVVVLDFWTYCCINCMHVLPDLKKLERKYPEQLVVIGVHSAKFDGEKDSENIRQAVLREKIEHPVINDSNMRLWHKYYVSSWPTLVLIDPEGNIVGIAPGEGNYSVLDQAIGRLVEYHRFKGTLDESPVHFNLERDHVESQPLSFPGKVLADEASDRLFVCDSNHNRIVVSSLNGQLIDTIGSGEEGSQNGSFNDASFFRPQGLCLDGDTLYIADTENHMIRKADLKERTVTTVSGTGIQVYSRAYTRVPAKTQGLNSPWALYLHAGKLFIAMAGPHQIWVYDPESDTIGAFAGSGKEDIIDGPHREAALAQPSGLTSDGQWLFVADSEGSSIRAISFDPDGNTTTLVGSAHLPEGRLFAFGDKLGGPNEAKFQHPLGVAYQDGAVYVADTYNNRIKVIDLKTKRTRAFVGTARAGADDEPPRFDEPSGLSVTTKNLYVADTNNHAIRVVDLQNKAVSTLTIQGLKPPQESKGDRRPNFPNPRQFTEKEKTLRANSNAMIHVSVQLKSGYKLNEQAPMVCLVEKVEGDEVLDLPAEPVTFDKPDVMFSVPFKTKSAGSTKLRVSVRYFPCQTRASGLCVVRSAIIDVPIVVADDAKDTDLSLKIAE